MVKMLRCGKYGSSILTLILSFTLYQSFKTLCVINVHYHLWFKWWFCRQASQFHESVNLQRRCARRCLHWWFCIHHSIMSRLRNPNCGVSPLSHYAWCWDTDRRKSDEINTKSDEVSKSRCEWMLSRIGPTCEDMRWWSVENCECFTRDYAGGESGGKSP